MYLVFVFAKPDNELLENSNYDYFKCLITYEPQSVKTSLNDEVVQIQLITHSLIYEVLRIYPENFMKISPLFMEIWSFETIHCLNFNTQRQKRHDVINDVKVNILICGLSGA